MLMIIPVAIVAVFTTIAMYVLRPVLSRFGFVDLPNHRSSHDRPTLRGGGVAILVGLLSGITSCLMIDQSPFPAAATLLTILYFGLLGSAEDFHGLPVRHRLGLQFAGVALALWILHTQVHFAGGLITPVLLAGVFYVNAANFMDGINGISGLHGLLVGSYFAALGWSQQQHSLMFVALVVAVSYASFLPWNFPRATVFMGDSGSYLLGATSWLLFAWSLTLTHDPIVASAPLLVYAFDVVLTLARRACRRERLSAAHREHVYQRVQQATQSHIRASTINASLTLVCGSIGLMRVIGSLSIQGAIVALLITLAVYALSPFFVRVVSSLKAPSIP